MQNMITRLDYTANFHSLDLQLFVQFVDYIVTEKLCRTIN